MIDMQKVIRNSKETVLNVFSEKGECPNCKGVIVNTSFRFAKVFSDFKCDSCKKEFRIIQVQGTTRIIENL